MGWGFYALRTLNLNVENNVFFGFRPVGIAFDQVRGLTLKNNIVSHVVERTTLETAGMGVDIFGGILACSIDYPSKCYDVSITDNIVAGAICYGFTAMGHDCGDDDQ